jgi:hypothetical protein
MNLQARISIGIVVVLTVLLGSDSSFANTGVFFGSGNQIIPIRNDDIRLVEEHVFIKIVDDWKCKENSVPFCLRADVAATFRLKNTTNKKVQFQAGFPFLDLQGFGDEKLAHSRLNFRVTKNGRGRRVILKSGLIEEKLDPNGLFKKVFAWDETFKPNEEANLKVSYSILLGMAAAHTPLRDFEEGGKKLYEIDRTLLGIVYLFNYITKTAYTWNGPIDKAVFEIDLSRAHRAFSRSKWNRSLPKELSAAIKRPLFLSMILPGGYEKNGNVIRWEFKEKVPEEGLAVQFAAYFVPRTESEFKVFCERFFKSKAKLATEKDLAAVYLGFLQRVLRSVPQNEAKFVQDYFKESQLPDLSLIFSDDEKGLRELAENLKAK